MSKINNSSFLKIKVLGESSFIFSEENTKIITDPWFGESIYGGSWTQFPPPKISIEDLKEITHIFISHVHSDHCCFSSLKKILLYSPNAKIIFLNRGEGRCFLKKKLLAKLGDSIQNKFLIQDAYKEQLNGVFRTWCIPPEDENPINKLVDSSLLIESKDGLILFANDNVTHSKHAQFINSLNLKSFLALIPFSGGSGYPSSYINLTEEEKLKIASSIRNTYQDRAILFLNETRFEYFMPVAGNHIIVGKSFNWHRTTSYLLNPYKTISSSSKKITFSKGIYFEPGNVINIKQSYLDEINNEYLADDFNFRKSHFIESISSRMQTDLNQKYSKEISNNFIEDYLHDVGEKLLKNLKKVKDKDVFSVYDDIFIINSSNKILFLNFSNFQVMEFKENNFFKYINNLDSKYWLSLKIEPKVLKAISERVFHINEADGSGLFEFWRNGDYYPELYIALFDSF